MGATSTGRVPYVRQVILNRERVPSFEKYPFNLPPVRTLRTLDLDPRVTFLIGENGTGKSTLLEAIAVAWGYNAEGGSRNFDFATRPSHSSLAEYLTLVKTAYRPKDGFFLRAESFYNVSTQIEELDKEGYGTRLIDSYGGTSLHEQSHGEAFLALMIHRFRGHGFYIMDEPEAALSPTRQLALMRRMHDLVQAESQFVIATHSPILLAYPHAKIVEVVADGLTIRKYEETDHYQVAKGFLDNPARTLEILFSDRERGAPGRDDA
jgi:predicted ATPase